MNHCILSLFHLLSAGNFGFYIYSEYGLDDFQDYVQLE